MWILYFCAKITKIKSYKSIRLAFIGYKYYNLYVSHET